MINHLLNLESVSDCWRHRGICLYLIFHVWMTGCHLELAGGPLSLMIYWFCSLLLCLDFSFSSSSLLFSPHHCLERRRREQLQPAKMVRKKKAPKTKEWMARLGSTLEGLTCFLLSLVNSDFYTCSPWRHPHSDFYRLLNTEAEKSHAHTHTRTHITMDLNFSICKIWRHVIGKKKLKMSTVQQISSK